MGSLLLKVLEESKEKADEIKKSAEKEFNENKEKIEKEFKRKIKELKDKLNDWKNKELEKLKNELEIREKNELLKEVKIINEECINKFTLNKKEKEKFFQIIKEKIKKFEKKYGKKYKIIGNEESLKTLNLKGEVNNDLSLGVIMDFEDFRINLTLENFLKMFKEELEKV